MTIKSQHSKVKIPVLSFFTGGGFLDMGFEQAGFDIVWTNEANPVFADIYNYGMTLWKRARNPSALSASIADRRSISALNPSSISKSVFPDGYPKLFGVIGGPPCPDFSVAGLNKGHSGDNGSLTKVFAKHICALRPSFFVMENVPGLFKTARHAKFLHRITRKFEQNGYVVDWKILNALDFGVPQDRQRLIIVGINRSLAQSATNAKISFGQKGWFPWPEGEFIDAKTKYQWPDTVPLGQIPTIPKNIPEQLFVGRLLNGNNPPTLYANADEFFKPYSRKFVITREGNTYRKSFKRLHRYRYSPAACYGNNEVHLHPWENRRLSVREALRIQGVDDTYVLPAEIPISPKFKLIANGVPVPLARNVAQSIRKFLKI